MNIQLLQWGLFTFMIGVVLSLPLAAVFYQKDSTLKKIFTNPRKLLSSHLDFLMQAFSIGLVYLLEFAMKSTLPLYVVIPLAFGVIGNPFILFLESTPLIRSGFSSIVYKLLKATSPVSLLFAWFAIAFHFLPLFLKISLLAIVLLGGFWMFLYLRKIKKQTASTQSITS